MPLQDEKQFVSSGVRSHAAGRVTVKPHPKTRGEDCQGMLTLDLLIQKTGLMEVYDVGQADAPALDERRPLYTTAERYRRDATGWTLVQGLLAPLQFAIFLVSLGLVTNYLVTDTGLYAATASVIAKTLALYLIMVTGSLWEKAVFGRYLFARAFFWEDVVGIFVIGLHTAYLICLATETLSVRGQMLLALAAYATYVVNATQFVLKLRTARREARTPSDVDLGAASWAGAQ